jgi:tRNA (guanine37-N1)-methyltransferase
VSLSESLGGIIPDSLLPLVPDRFEVIGDIALVTLPEALLPYRVPVARAIISGRRSISTVLRRISGTEGTIRVAGYEPVIGSKTATICRESGFSYRVDIAHTFFTSRLAAERQRIASLIRPGEQIFIPFAGVGPFVIPAAVKGAAVTALEINPVACRLLSDNIRLNTLRTHPAVIRGDALTADRLFTCRFDRAILPTPYGLNEAFGPVERVVKPGGNIHFYTFGNRSQAEERKEWFRDSGFTVTRCHRCGNTAPSVSRWVYDLVKEENPNTAAYTLFTRT